MFSNLNKTGFGATTTASFGFGNAAAPNQTPFGQTQLFGKPASTGGFGSAAPIFGANTQQPAPLFGGTTNAFGAAPQQSSFGTSGLFGQQNVPVSNTLFGSTTTSAFGQQAKPSIDFGFNSGTAAPLFGQQPQTFQPSTSAGIFGTSNAFGGSPAQMGTVVKFNPVTGTDTMAKSGLAHSINTKHHCITCMKEYENKSLEELRWEDYQCNRKGPQQGGGFGGLTSSAAPSLFAENKPTFGQINTFAPSSSGFGLTSQANQQTSLFGKPTTGFGTQTTPSFSGFNTPNNVFGNNTAAVKPFGSAQTQNMFATTQPSGFGAAGSSLFGQQQTNVQAPTGGFFNKPAQPAFSSQQQQQQPMFSFGQATPTTQTSFFQQSKPATSSFGSFGQTNLNANTGFGQKQTTGLFTQQAQNPFNTFSKPAAPLFGQTAQPTFGLGTQQPPAANLFGTTAAAKPLFGGTGTQTSFFSAPAPQAGGFALPQQQPVLGLGATSEPNLDFHTVVEKIYEPFPRYPFLDELDISRPKCHNTTNPIMLKQIMDNPKVPISPSSNVTKFRIMHSAKPASRNPKYNMLDGLQDKSTSPWTGKRLNLSKTVDNQYNSRFDEPDANAKTWVNKQANNSTGFEKSKTPNEKDPPEIVPELYPTLPAGDVDTDLNTTPIINRGMIKASKIVMDVLEQDVNTPNEDTQNSRSVRFEDDSKSPSFSDATGPQEVTEMPLDTCGIKLERAEYYTLPPLAEISKFKNESGACIIKGFTVGREGYGNIYFPDALDVSNLNLDEIVHIRYREVIVYTDDDNKPVVGEGLNRPAQVTIDRVWPRDPDTKQMMKDASEIVNNNFIERLAAMSEKQNAKFVDYRPETGSWVFTVQHFSKYKYIEVEEDQKLEDVTKSHKLVEMQMEEQQNVEEVFPDPIRYGLGGLRHQDSFPAPPSFSLHRNALEPKSVVIMKSTFFDHDSMSDDASSCVEFAPVLAPRPAPPRSVKPKRFALRNPNFIVPIERSLPLLRNYVDMQVFKGRSFKVGWGRGFRLAVPLPVTIGNEKLGDCSRGVVVCVEVAQFKNSMVELEKQMEAILSETVVSLDEFGVPSCAIKPGTKCLEKLREAALDDAGKQVWNLCLALWGPGAATVTERNDLFSEWLEDIAAPKIAAALEPITKSSAAYLKNIYQHLTGHQIEAASSLAIVSDHPQLAVAIPASFNNDSRALFYAQLHTWKDSDALKYIDTNLIKIYMLLGGIPVIGDINVCESLDWKRSLAVHFWYICPAGISLTAAVQAYREAFTSVGYASRPIPEHYRGAADSTNDVLYNIMLLFGCSSLPLYNVLNPACYSENPLDAHLSWLLLQTFSALQTGTIGEHAHDYVCASFATQLEHLGAWQWAVYVTLFIKNKLAKHATIMSIFERNLTDLQNADFLVNDARINPKWIHAVLAQKSSDSLQTFSHLILANDYGKTHELAINSLIPKFVETRQFDLLTKLLKDLVPARAAVRGWQSQEGIILDFLDVYHKVMCYKNEPNDFKLCDFELRNVKGTLESLCARMKDFPHESPHQSKALATICQFVAELVVIVYCEVEGDVKSKKTAWALIKNLVMPYDYVHIELDKINIF